MKEDLPLSYEELEDKLAQWKRSNPEQVTVFIGDSELVTGHEALIAKQEVAEKNYKGEFSKKA